MSTKGITPRLAESLRLLAASQLQTQVSRSVALDASLLGVMAIDAAVATTNSNARSCVISPLPCEPTGERWLTVGSGPLLPESVSKFLRKLIRHKGTATTQ